MGWLTGQQVKTEVENNRIRIHPFNPSQLNPNSYDYRLAPLLRILLPNSTHKGISCIDPKLPMKFKQVTIPKSGYLLRTKLAYLGHTVEKFGSQHFASLCTGKSSIGRLFIKNHACAGLIDQGFYGHITLEITAKIPIIVYPNMRFGQMFWFQSIGDIELYSGKYNVDNAAAPSRINQDLGL